MARAALMRLGQYICHSLSFFLSDAHLEALLAGVRRVHADIANGNPDVDMIDIVDWVSRVLEALPIKIIVGAADDPKGSRRAMALAGPTRVMTRRYVDHDRAEIGRGGTRADAQPHTSHGW
jgi:hypothetical protein